ncbi:restriction endonuclease [Helicobacter equorum]|uniref:Restriction endonuclease type IV Mrr domain-containing protein n=1 Tax=Helicobacter equorum TaxID=361872 RepID=A0A3D8IV85_9HELI|nr:restriction endonuclease [Helicobacter equorum]RDU68554.1 hypothetical protein CQA54_01765 [Helicobacter equorum]
MSLLWKMFYHIFLKKPKKYSYKTYKQYSNFDNAQANKQKGDKYEQQILKLYKKQGYKVYPQGFIKGKADGGIDLIAYKGNEALLIQCKNWEYSQVKQEHLRIFLGDCTAYLEKNHNIFAKKKVKRVFVTSCKNIDYGVQKFVEENNVEYKIIPYNHR